MSDTEQSTPQPLPGFNVDDLAAARAEGRSEGAACIDVRELVVAEMRGDLLTNPRYLTVSYLLSRLSKWHDALGGVLPEVPKSDGAGSAPVTAEEFREWIASVTPRSRFLDRDTVDAACGLLREALGLMGDADCPPLVKMGEAVRHVGNALETLAELYGRVAGGRGAPRTSPAIAAEQARLLLDRLSEYAVFFCQDLPEPREKSVDAYHRRGNALILLITQCKRSVSAERFAAGRKSALGSIPNLDAVPDGLHPLATRGVRRPGVPVDEAARPVLVDTQPEEMDRLWRAVRHLLDEVPS